MSVCGSGSDLFTVRRSLVLVLILALAIPVTVRPVAAQDACPPGTPPPICALPPEARPPHAFADEPNIGDGAMAPAVAAAALAAAPANVTVTDLGTLGGTNSTARSINDAGQIVGSSDLPGDSTYHAFLWTAADGMRDLGTLGGSWSVAYDINTSGQVVGYSTTARGATRAFVWSAATGMRDLGTLGGAASYALAINDAGEVVGYSSTAGSPAQAFVWSAATGMRAIGTLGGDISYAYGINDVGQVVGYSAIIGGDRHAFVWSAATGMRDLGTLGEGEWSYAWGINDAGQVVGYSDTTGTTAHAFVWTAATGMRDLGTLGGRNSYAWAINTSAQVVGWSGTASGATHAFVWTAGDGMRDLGTVGGTWSVAYGINDAGQIAGYSYVAGDGAYHAARWTPSPLIAADAFGRTVANGWGSAQQGGAYTLRGAASVYAVNGSAGTMTLPRGTGGAAFLSSVRAQNVDVRVRVATDKLAVGAQQFAYIALRSVGTNTEYRAQLRINPNRTVQARLARAVNNAETTLGTIAAVPNVTHQANGFIWLRVQATGTNPTTLRVKAWGVGQAEPAAWLVTATDTTAALQTTGSVGLQAFVPSATTNAPVRFSFDDLQVRGAQP